MHSLLKRQLSKIKWIKDWMNGKFHLNISLKSQQVNKSIVDGLAVSNGIERKLKISRQRKRSLSSKKGYVCVHGRPLKRDSKVRMKQSCNCWANPPNKVLQICNLYLNLSLPVTRWIFISLRRTLHLHLLVSACKTSITQKKREQTKTYLIYVFVCLDQIYT